MTYYLGNDAWSFLNYQFMAESIFVSKLKLLCMHKPYGANPVIYFM